MSLHQRIRARRDRAEYVFRSRSRVEELEVRRLLSWSVGPQGEPLSADDTLHADIELDVQLLEPPGSGGASRNNNSRAWTDPTITFSFMPDGSSIVSDRTGVNSLWAALTDRFGSAGPWQREMARALDAWAAVTSLNFVQVSDNGAAFNTAGQVQHDSRFGDIRIGAFRMDGPGGILAQGYSPPPNGSTAAGDTHLDTSESWSLGSGGTDLFTAFLHEVGHALGLNHSLDASAVMSSVYSGPRSGLAPSDVQSIQSLYGLRRPDAFAGNVSIGKAFDLSAQFDATSEAVVRGDLTTSSERDHFRFVAPASGAIDVVLTSKGLSLLDPKLWLLDSNERLFRGSNATGYGETESIRFDGLRAGATYFVVVDGSSDESFAVGAYELKARVDANSGPANDDPDAADCLSVRQRLTSARDVGLSIQVQSSDSGVEKTLRILDGRMRPMRLGLSEGRFSIQLRPGRGITIESWCGNPAAPTSFDIDNELHIDQGRVLHVLGSDRADQISVVSGLDVIVNELSYQFASSAIRGLKVQAGGGDDRVSIESDLQLPASIFGGDGDDVLLGGAGNDSLDGGRGNDSIGGAAGNDRIVGGADVDFLDDGLGDDFIFAELGDDLWQRGAGKNVVKGTPRETNAPNLAQFRSSSNGQLRRTSREPTQVRRCSTNPVRPEIQRSRHCTEN